MLENTFRHLSGFGALRERRLWARGICDWDGYEEFVRSQLLLFPDVVASSELEASRRALEACKRRSENPSRRRPDGPAAGAA